MPTILARDDEGRLLDVTVVEDMAPGSHRHDDRYARSTDLVALEARVAALEKPGKGKKD